MEHTPHQLVDQHLGVGTAMVDGISRQETVIAPL
jgi:hypothetical protein